MVRNAIESDFRSSKMAGVGDFVKKKVVYDVFVYDLACLLHGLMGDCFVYTFNHIHSSNIQ